MNTKNSALKWVAPKDIISCEDEAIHIIGKVQNFGALLGVNRDTFEISYASENISEMLNISLKIGDNLFNLPEDAKVVLDCANLIKLGGALNNPYKVLIKGKKYNLISHTVGDFIIFEFEEGATSTLANETQSILGASLLRIGANQEDLASIYNTVAAEIKSIIGFDRVMIYKFWDDWHGEVVGEAKEASQDPFFGLHYPASDIPVQARELYKKNLTRLIGDCEHDGFNILTNVETALDLSMAQTRAVSPIHLEYLRNMGVGASFSISIIVNKVLWGLIVCHNNKPAYLNYEQRKASELISTFLSSKITDQNKIREEKRLEKLMRAVDAIDANMRLEWDVANGLEKDEQLFLDVTDCKGGAYVSHNNITTFGITPPNEHIEKLITWIKGQSSNSTIFNTSCISNFVPEMRFTSDNASGVLSVALTDELNEFIVWFKPEKLTSVSWAGKDEKELVETENNKFRMSPRKSFDKWVEEVKYTSNAWTSEELSSARRLRDKILTVKQIKSNEIERLNARLQEAYKDLDAFSYTLSHDLKTPLNTITGYVELLAEDEELEANPLLINVLKNTKIMTEMIENILEYSKLGREKGVYQPVTLVPILLDIKEQMSGGRGFKNIIIDVPEDLIISGNKTMIYQVFLNLIENGVKYANPKNNTPEVKISVKELEEGNVQITVSDNGIGVDVKNADKIFNLFQRVNISREIEGSGVGLAIVKKIVENHDGRIWVESELRVGSKFHVILHKP